MRQVTAVIQLDHHDVFEQNLSPEEFTASVLEAWAHELRQGMPLYQLNSEGKVEGSDGRLVARIYAK